MRLMSDFEEIHCHLSESIVLIYFFVPKSPNDTKTSSSNKPPFPAIQYANKRTQKNGIKRKRQINNK